MADIIKLVHIAVNFGTITGFVGTQTVAAMGFYSASSGGTLHGAGPLGSPISLNDGDTINFAIDAIKIKQKGGTGSVIGDGDAKAFLDLRYGSGSPATLYAALLIAIPSGDGTGGTEFTGGTYARIAVTNNATNFPPAS